VLRSQLDFGEHLRSLPVFSSGKRRVEVVGGVEVKAYYRQLGESYMGLTKVRYFATFGDIAWSSNAGVLYSISL
jgi:hypothetical protein